ncbi:hypothetical protein ABIE33_002541 [Ensifer sp. 4252]
MSPMRSYLTELRGLIGNRLLLLPSVAAVIHDHAGKLLLQEKSSGRGGACLPARSSPAKRRRRPSFER